MRGLLGFLEKDLIYKASKNIDLDNIPPGAKGTYGVLIDGNTYPFKLLITETAKLAGVQLTSADFQSSESLRDRFENEFEYPIKTMNQKDPVLDLIARYKANLKKEGLQDEVYKWELLGQYGGRFNTDAEDFIKEVNEVHLGNVIYHMAVAVMKLIVEEKEDSYKECFQKLYDETIPLEKRINDFHEETLSLYKEVNPNTKTSHHHDERTIATLLTFKYPNKYTLYKNSFYKKYCQLIGVKSETKKNKKYPHYLELIDELIQNYIQQDQELLDILQSSLPASAFDDLNHKILAQDILYTTLDKDSSKPPRYWRVGTKDGDISYWPDMKEDGKVCIGWPNIGDLNSHEISSKKELIKLLTDNGHYLDDKINASKKAGEILNFYSEMNVGDIVLAQSGYDILGIGIVEGDYEYNPKHPFPHQKPVQWKAFSPAFKNAEGNLTTVKEIKKQHTIDQINKAMKEQSSHKSQARKMDFEKNQILFGPPGTGKTYNTINKALEILGIDITEMSRNEITNEFRSRIKQGKIVFTTFHQSMSYEEFIEGIKPIEPEKEGDNIIYKVEPGLFKKLCIEASFDFARRDSKSSETAEVLSFSTVYDKFIDEVEEEMLKGKPYNLQTKSGGSVIIESITSQRNIQIKHQNGARSYTVSKSRLTKLNSEIDNLDKVNNINDEFREIIGGSNSSAYWSVLNAINKFKSKAGHTPTTQNLSFEDKVDVVDKMTHEDYQSNEANNYVLIIDEINRGNVSQIFGELITLLEKDKRLGKEEALKTKLPYSKESFGIPPNLYVIGTMNTADRSVEALDTALRRRFSFTEMPPQPELINPKEMILRLWNKEEYSDVLNWDDAEFRKEADELYELLGIDPVFERDFHSEINENEELEAWTKEDLKDLNEELFIGVNLEDILRTINNRIEVLLDKDHLIGHSFFMKVGNIEDLKVAFSKEIIPLLQEYFFGDYGKISLVLGEGFCKGIKVSETNNKGLFAKVSSGYDDSVYSDKIIHTISKPVEMKNEEFINAIQMLLNQ